MSNINRKILVNNIGKIILLSSFWILLIFYFCLRSIADVSSSCTAVPLPTANTPKVEIHADGITMVNGKPFFPFGFYDVSWKSTADERMNHLRDIADAGFNTIHASVTRLDDYEAFLDEAERLGVYVLSEQNVGLLNLVNAFKHKPAVLGWSIADDVDDGTWPPQKVLESHQQVKASDPNHITYVSGYSESIGRFANCSDVIAIQSYPIKVGKAELSSTYSKVSVARDAIAKFNGAVYANLQTFNWSFTNRPEYKDARIPTFSEVRNMTYQALLAGAKGIIYYAYHDRGWHLPDSSNLWKELKSLVPEIKAVSSSLLEGDFREINTGVKNVLAGIWVSKDQALTVIVNNSYKNNAEVAIELPVGVSEARPMFEGRPSGMSVKEGKLSGSLNPLEVHVYSLKA